MSYQIGIDTIHLRPTPRLGHTEYCSHDALMRHVGGSRRFLDLWDIDLVWCCNDGPIEWSERGRTTDMGHSEYVEGGVDRRPPSMCPFKDPSDIWAFDAVEEYGLPDFDELVTYYEQTHRQGRAATPDVVVPGGYYKTIVSGAIASFGWEMLLTAAVDLSRFERVLDSFFRLALHHVRAWAQTSIEVFISHDDMVWTEGPFLSPDFYRSVIFPRYRALWTVLREAGKRVLFCSDGNWTQFLDDIAEAGAHGFIFEPMVSLDAAIERYGQTHVIVGSKVDCRTLTFDSKDAIRAQVDATLESAMRCPGFIFAVGNHIPSNVPLDNAQFYIEYLRAHWTRP